MVMTEISVPVPLALLKFSISPLTPLRSPVNNCTCELPLEKLIIFSVLVPVALGPVKFSISSATPLDGLNNCCTDPPELKSVMTEVLMPRR